MVGGAEGEGVPAVAPGTAGAGVGIEDEEIGPGGEATMGELLAGSKPGLTCADNNNPEM